MPLTVPGLIISLLLRGLLICPANPLGRCVLGRPQRFQHGAHGQPRRAWSVSVCSTEWIWVPVSPSLSGIRCEGSVSRIWPHTPTNRSPTMMANWVFAAVDSLAGVFQSRAILRKTRKISLIATSSLGK